MGDMPQDYKAKIGSLIHHARLQRGMTQQQLAKALKTSQSAVTRIEKGGQNISLEMLARISDVLSSEIVTLNQAGTLNFRINGAKTLGGTLEVKTSKNAAVGLLCASLINRGTTTLKKMPRIEEVYRLIEVLQSIGVQVKWINSNEDLQIKPPRRLKLDNLDQEAARKTRSVIMLMGPLMRLTRQFRLPYAGGCKLGERTVRPHLFALEEFGLSVTTRGGWYDCRTRAKSPGKVIMYESGDTASENALMAAALTPGTTEITMASSNYMVQEMCFFLERLGVRIEGIGTHRLKVRGLSKPPSAEIEYYPSEDPIEAMTFLSIAGVTNSPIVIKRAPLEFLELELLKLQKMGMRIEQGLPYLARNGRTRLVDLVCRRHEGLTALEDKIEAHPFPGLNMDNLPYFVPLAAAARGRTLIHDPFYENRAIYFTELAKLGANVTLIDIHRVQVDGPTRWKAAEVICPPALRPAVLILIGMLAAEGKSVLRNVYSINRGYEDLASRLNQLGADIETFHDI